MSWFQRSLGPVALDGAARHLIGVEGAFLARDHERTFLGAFPCERSTAVDPEPDLRPTAWSSPLPRWLGLLPYEAFRGAERARVRDTRAAPLLERCEWRRYPAVAVHDRGALRVEGEDEGAVVRLAELLAQPPTAARVPASLFWAASAEPGEAHAERVRRALEQIDAGQLYQVNLARRFEFTTQSHPIELLEALGLAGRAPFSLALSFGEVGVVSGSPELFLDVTPDGRIETRPIKGTRPRGATPALDLAQRIELEQSEKEQAELTMVIDLERNDLGRVAEIGSVHVSRAPHVVTHPTVHHREAAVTAQLRAGVTRTELLEATMPSGSVTGAPKQRAMELIAELEPVRRGLYTGALGLLGHDGHLRLSMAIRVLTLRGTVAHYYAGGGIVAESVPDSEVHETWWKTRFLGELLDVEN